MAVVGRSIRPSEASDINNEGASTDQERTQAIADHIAEHHAGSGNNPPNEHYYDETRDKNLSTQIFYVDFFRPGQAKKRYLNYKQDRPSSDIPYKSLAPYDYCLVGYQFYMLTDKAGDIVELRDKTNNFATITTVNLTSPGHEQYDDSLDTVIVSGTELSAYATDTTSEDPLLRIFLRRIYI